MDFPFSTNETAAVRIRTILHSARRAIRDAMVQQAVARVALLGVAVATLSGCERIKDVVAQNAVREEVDTGWQRDSTLLASTPPLLFRVLHDERGAVVVPLARIGDRGYRRLRMADRGWRAFDLRYLHENSALDAIENGRIAGNVRMTRGMWEGTGQLDTAIAGCGSWVPAGIGQVSRNVALAVSGFQPKPAVVSGLSAGELNQALATIPTLVAPLKGIGTSQFARYKREVHVLSTGVSNSPTILVLYDDPEQVPDTVRPIAVRPRHLTVALDKGVFGYKPSYRFATVGNAMDNPRLKFLDFVDVDNDGRGELFFSVERGGTSGLVALRFENEEWRELLREDLRCPRR